jgi:uncharacterized protein YjiK
LSLAAIGLLWLVFNYFLLGHNTGYLADYELVSGPVRIADNAEQSSGLAFNSELNQLYVIVNTPPSIYILSPQGEYIRKIDLSGFDDTEGITYLGHETFAVVAEKLGTVSWFTLEPDTQSIDFNAVKSVKLFPQPVKNKGLEGISYAADLRQLFVVKERKQKKIFAIQWPVKYINQPLISIPWDAESKPWWSVRGLSGIHYDPQTGHLFIVSRRSRRIIEYTLSGEEVGSFSLKAGSATLQHAIRKAEGIVIASDGTLYICGEPNQLYIFKKQDREQAKI